MLVRMPWLCTLVSSLLAALVAGCFDPQYGGDAIFACDPGDPVRRECPEGYTCLGETMACHRKCTTDADCQQTDSRCENRPEVGGSLCVGTQPNGTTECAGYTKLGGVVALGEDGYGFDLTMVGSIPHVVYTDDNDKLHHWHLDEGTWKETPGFGHPAIHVAVAPDDSGRLHVVYVTPPSGTYGGKMEVRHCFKPDPVTVCEPDTPVGSVSVQVGEKIVGLDLDFEESDLTLVVALAQTQIKSSIGVYRLFVGDTQGYQDELTCARPFPQNIRHPRVARTTGLTAATFWSQEAGDHWELLTVEDADQAMLCRNEQRYSLPDPPAGPSAAAPVYYGSTVHLAYVADDSHLRYAKADSGGISPGGMVADDVQFVPPSVDVGHGYVGPIVSAMVAGDPAPPRIMFRTGTSWTTLRAPSPPPGYGYGPRLFTRIGVNEGDAQEPDQIHVVHSGTDVTGKGSLYYLHCKPPGPE